MLNLPTLKYRRKRGDLIQVFKILNGHYDINWEDFFTLDTDRTHNTRGHSKKLVKHRTLTSMRQKSFCYRVVDHWNNLTEEIVTAKTVTSFKTLLDKRLVNIGITHVFHALIFAGSRGCCLNTRPIGRVFKHLPRDPASVNAMKQTCVIVILAYFTLFQPNSH